MQEQERHDEVQGSGGKKGKGDAWLTVIGIGKLIKVSVLVAVGIAALTAVHHDPPSMLTHAADIAGVDPGSRHLHRIASKLAGASSKQLEEIGFGSFVYAALFAVEGIGLLLKKRWAEYFTIFITTSFVPLEIYELTRHFSAVKVVTLALNLLVVAYLVVRVIRERKKEKGGKGVSERSPSRDGASAPARLGIASR